MRWPLWVSVLCALPLLASCATAECSTDDECSAGRYCGGGDCKQDCASDDHCPLGLVCTGRGRCQRASDDGGVPDGAGPRDLGTDGPAPPPPPIDMGVPPPPPPIDMGVPPPPPIDMGLPPPPDSGPPPGTGVYLETCITNADCTSGHCVPDGPGPIRVCSRACTRSADCADWHFCLQGSAGAPGWCTWNDAGNPCSGSASADECAFACLSSSSPGSGHCTHLCERAADCPGGYACVLADPTDPASLRVCAWIHKACPMDSTQCPTTLGGCGPDASGSTEGTQCTGGCQSDADCPQVFGGAYDCGRPAGFRFDVCQPPTAADGASGEPCAADADCRSGICALAETGDPTAVCLERCVPGVGCAVGFGCTPVVLTGTGAAANVCVPAGRARTGDSCARGRDCRSGACSSASRTCIDTCQSGACPPGFTCTAEGLTVEGVMLRTCRR